MGSSLPHTFENRECVGHPATLRLVGWAPGSAGRMLFELMTSKQDALFERIAATQYEECEAEWTEVLKRLRFSPEYIPAVQEVMSQGRWRQQPNPVAYIRKAAKRCAVRIGIVDSTPWTVISDLNYRGENGNQVNHDDKIDLALAEYGRKYGYQEEGEEFETSPIDRVSAEYLKLSRNKKTGAYRRTVDWKRVASVTGMDYGERIVVELRLKGFGREEALAACATDEDRRYLQAAWKRFDRHMASFREALLMGSGIKPRRIRQENVGRKLLIKKEKHTDVQISFPKLVPRD